MSESVRPDDRRQPRRHHLRLLVLAISTVLVLVVVAVVLVIAGDDNAGGGRSGEIGEGDATGRGDLRPPGSPIAGGISVAPGSSLVGSVAPLAGYAFGSDSPFAYGWQALLVVDSDPVGVWNAYIDAFGIDQADATDSCVVSAWQDPATTSGSTATTTTPDDYVPPLQRKLTEPRLPGENHIGCHFSSETTRVDMAVGMTQFCFDVYPPKCSLRPVSQMRIAVTDTTVATERWGAEQRPNPFDGRMSLPDQPTTVEVSVIPPEFDVPDVGSLPTAGQRFDAGIDYYLDGAQFTKIPAGGRSLTAPSLLISCNSGLVAVLELVGTPDEVIDDIDRPEQFDGFFAVIRGQGPDGTHWAYGAGSATGGFGVDFTAVEAGEDTSFVFITECGD